MSASDEAPWLAAWRAWTSLASKGFKSASAESPFATHDAAANHFAEPYLAFARAVQQMLKQGDGQDFAARFTESLYSAARQAAGTTGHDDFLNACLGAAPAALLSVCPDANAGQAWRQWSSTLAAWAHEWLALPAIGPQREWVEMVKAVQRAAQNESEARAVIDEHYRLATRAALQGFADFLGDSSGEPITTLRTLYDAWIEQAEASYAERVMSEAFGRDFAAWVNAGSEVRLALRQLGGRLSALFDAPARDEIDALHERQQAMQRELSALRAERDAARAVAAATDASTLVGDAAGHEPASANATPRVAPKISVRPVKAEAKKAAKPPRARESKPRQPKVARGEFDIAHILDAGK